MKYWFVDHKGRYTRKARIADDNNEVFMEIAADGVMAMKQQLDEIATILNTAGIPYHDNTAVRVKELALRAGK
jgi:hypothetical protein